VKRHVKASSAGSTSSRGASLGSLRGAFTTRASSRRAEGSGAPAHRHGRIALSLAVFTFAALLLAPSAFASKEVINYFGTVDGSGSLGGEFHHPVGVAVNAGGNGPANAGDVYVVDSKNNRIERFDSFGNFISAWGADVIAAGKPGDVAGINPFEVCTVAADCQAAVASGGNGATSGNGSLGDPQGVAVDGDSGNVYVSDRGNNRINVYDGVGNFIASFGFDTDATTAGTDYEVCPAADVCKAGVPGAGAGQIGSSLGEILGDVLGIAVSPADGSAATGNVFLADSENRRVNTYDLDGGSPSSFGSSATFGETQPRLVAVDSRGIVYASNSKLGGEVERYDSQNANGGGTVFLAPIEASRNERQEIHFSGFADSDKFKLTCPNGEVTGYTPWTSSSEVVKKLDENYGSTCKSDVLVSGQPPYTTITLEYQGAFAATDVPTMTCFTVAGSGSCSVSTEQDGQKAALLNAGEFSQLGTQGLAVGPDSDGGGPDTDTLYVLRDPRPGNTVVQQFGPANEPGLTAAPTAVDDIHGSGASIESGGGLGLNDVSGQLLVSSEARVADGDFKHGVYILADPATIPAPGLTIDPIAAKTDTTATFSGTVDPKDALVSCKFQYSTDQLSWSDVPAPGCRSLTVTGGSQAVSANATGLDPNTHYFVRLAVSRPFILNSTITSAIVRNFDTDAPPPVISNVGAIQVTDTSARLVGAIDPRHSATGYVFEYGTTPALGSATAPLNIGSGTKPIAVSQVLGGLKKDTDYYFRLVATNATATAASAGKSFHTRATTPPPASSSNCANEGLREQQSSTRLPDCRAYEMVSPADKNQGGVDQSAFNEFQMALSRNGEAATFCTNALFGESVLGHSGQPCAPYLSKRTPTGWQTTDPVRPYCPYDRNGFTGGQQGLLNPDFDRVFIRLAESTHCAVQPIDPGAADQSFNLYRGDLTTSPSSFELVKSDSEYAGYDSVLLGGSDDFSHVVFRQAGQGDPNVLYDWEREGHGACVTPGGCINLISRGPDDVPFATASDLPTDVGISPPDPLSSAISADGERIYFQNSGRLYMREGNAVTYDLSTPECAVPADCGSGFGEERFDWANEAGDVVLFRSYDKLTDESAPQGSFGKKLYRWDRDAPPGNRLTDLSTAVTLAGGAQPLARGILGASEDGSVVYLVNNKELYRVVWNGGNPTAERLGPYFAFNLSGDSDAGDYLPQNSEFLTLDPNVLDRFDRVSADGKYLTITTPLALNLAADRDEDLDAYRWGEGEGWTCVSCQLPGVPSAGGVNTMITECCDKGAGFYSIFVFGAPSHMISDDGQRIFFTSRDALVPEDVNGEVSCPRIKITNHSGSVYACDDVYEWHDGTLSLISSGTASEGSFLIGVDSSGEDVAFITHDRLVGWDTDNGTDIYDARIGGGFPEPPAQPAICEGEACRGAGAIAPVTTGAGTAVFEGAGNPVPKHNKAKAKKHRKKHHHKHQRAKHDRRATR